MDSALNKLISEAQRQFHSRHGCDARWVAWAPGRVNLIGEHVDYNDGLVLPLAIDRWIVAVGGPVERPDATGVVDCPDMPAPNALDWSRLSEQVDALPRWAHYVAGAHNLFPVEVLTMNVVITGNIAPGAGLSSSAALCVSLLTLFEQATEHHLTLHEKAHLAQHIEHEFASVPCGMMDQLASIHGRRDHALCIDCRSSSVEPVPLPPANRIALLVAHSGVKHELATSGYATRRKECEQALLAINRHLETSLKSLRDLTLDALSRCESAIESVLWRRAAHVVTEIERTRLAVIALQAGDLRELGRLVSASHASLRDWYEVSCPELDTIVDSAVGEPGVFGARMIGGGFGGSAIVLCERERWTTVSTAIANKFARIHTRQPDICEVRAVQGASGIQR